LIDSDKFLNKNTLNLLYDILNIKHTHGMEFNDFFDLLVQTSLELGIFIYNYRLHEV